MEIDKTWQWLGSLWISRVGKFHCIQIMADFKFLNINVDEKGKFVTLQVLFCRFFCFTFTHAAGVLMRKSIRSQTKYSFLNDANSRHRSKNCFVVSEYHQQSSRENEPKHEHKKIGNFFIPFARVYRQHQSTFDLRRNKLLSFKHFGSVWEEIFSFVYLSKRKQISWRAEVYFVLW